MLLFSFLISKVCDGATPFLKDNVCVDECDTDNINIVNFKNQCLQNCADNFFYPHATLSQSDKLSYVCLNKCPIPGVNGYTIDSKNRNICKECETTKDKLLSDNYTSCISANDCQSLLINQDNMCLNQLISDSLQISSTKFEHFKMQLQNCMYYSDIKQQCQLTCQNSSYLYQINGMIINICFMRTCEEIIYKLVHPTLVSHTDYPLSICTQNCHFFVRKGFAFDEKVCFDVNCSTYSIYQQKKNISELQQYRYYSDAHMGQQLCSVKCKPSGMWAFPNLTCSANGCLSPWLRLQNQSDQYCVKECPTGYRTNNDKECFETCPNNLLVYKSKCVAQCPTEMKLNNINVVNQLFFCETYNNEYLQLQSLKINNTNDLIYVKYENCSQLENKFVKETNYPHICIQNCSSGQRFIIQQDNQQYCVPGDCSFSIYNKIFDQQCIKNCSERKLYESQNHCFRSCREISMWNFNNMTCVLNCSETEEQFSDDESGQCVHSCRYLNKLVQNGTCVMECDDTFNEVENNNGESYCIKYINNDRIIYIAVGTSVGIILLCIIIITPIGVVYSRKQKEKKEKHTNNIIKFKQINEQILQQNDEIFDSIAKSLSRLSQRPGSIIGEETLI